MMAVDSYWKATMAEIDGLRTNTNTTTKPLGGGGLGLGLSDEDLTQAMLRFHNCLSLVTSTETFYMEPEDWSGGDDEEDFCPAIFDSWKCWRATRKRMTREASCPSFVPGFSANSKCVCVVYT